MYGSVILRSLLDLLDFYPILVNEVTIKMTGTDDSI